MRRLLLTPLPRARGSAGGEQWSIAITVTGTVGQARTLAAVLRRRGLPVRRPPIRFIATPGRQVGAAERISDAVRRAGSRYAFVNPARSTPAR
jgi:hypothetical protein